MCIRAFKLCSKAQVQNNWHLKMYAPRLRPMFSKSQNKLGFCIVSAAAAATAAGVCEFVTLGINVTRSHCGVHCQWPCIILSTYAYDAESIRIRGSCTSVPISPIFHVKCSTTHVVYSVVCAHCAHFSKTSIIILPLNEQWLMYRPKLSSHRTHVWLRDVAASFITYAGVNVVV